MRAQSVHYVGGAIYKPTKVRFIGTGALKKGTGVCWDYGWLETDTPQPIGVTAAKVEGLSTDAWEMRGNVVNVPIGGSPSTTARGENNRRFAGVLAQDYAANAKGQIIEIYEPGSVCEIAIGYSDTTTIDATMLTCSAGQGDPGRFNPGVFEGRGSAICMQTTSGNVLEDIMTGAAALDATGLILTDGAADFITAGVAAGDKVYILGVENDATNSGTPAPYTVSSVTNLTTLVLTAAASDGGTMQCSYYIQNGNPTCLALLMEGNESGLVEHIMPGGAGHASADTFIIMEGGKTFLLGGGAASSGSEDWRETLDAPLAINTEKIIECLGTITTDNIEVKIVGTMITGATLATATFDTATNDIHVAYKTNGWHEQGLGTAARA